jgi:hypothetical protein
MVVYLPNVTWRLSMSMVDIVLKMPWWYLVILILFSLYYAIRGIMEKKIAYAESPLSQREKVIQVYIQEFLFKVVFTVSGFLALFIANYIFSFTGSVSDIGAGTAILLIFLILWGITGISGYLTFLIVSGKFPTLK